MRPGDGRGGLHFGKLDGVFGCLLGLGRRVYRMRMKKKGKARRLFLAAGWASGRGGFRIRRCPRSVDCLLMGKRFR